MYGPFFGALGTTAAMSLTAAGAAYGTYKSASSIAHASCRRPEIIMRSLIPVIMAGIVAIYGLVVSVIMGAGLVSSAENYTTFRGYAQFSAGLVCGMCGLFAGYAIGSVGDSGVRAYAQQPRVFVGMVLMLIFAEVCLQVVFFHF